MKRTIEVEKTIKTNNIEKAIDKFFNKHPELEYWKDTFKYMVENNESFFSDTTMADGTRNNNWVYALHLDINENVCKKDFTVYMCIIERA